MIEEVTWSLVSIIFICAFLPPLYDSIVNALFLVCTAIQECMTMACVCCHLTPIEPGNWHCLTSSADVCLQRLWRMKSDASFAWTSPYILLFFSFPRGCRSSLHGFILDPDLRNLHPKYSAISCKCHPKKDVLSSFISKFKK